MPLYCTIENVKLRLIGKTRFTDDDNDPNKLQTKLLVRLIDEAEGQVEQDLSPRYFAPLMTQDNKPFTQLPDRPTKQIVQTLAELLSVIRVLETDFGRGSSLDGDAYAAKLQERYDKILNDKILKKKEEHSNQWFYPPLPNLRLALFNTEADDGYAGMVLTTSSGIGSEPLHQMNDPGQSWWSGLSDHDEDLFKK
jgi:hypothetical protein